MIDFKNPPCELGEEFVVLELKYQPHHEMKKYLLCCQGAKILRESVGGIWVVDTAYWVFFGAEWRTPRVIPV